MADFSSVFNSVPPVTRFLLISTAAITGPTLLQIIAPFHVALIWPRVFYKLEIWRPFTAFFFGGAGFPLLYDFFLIYRNSSTLERDTYHGDTAEYTWVHLVLALIILTLNTLLGHPFLFRPLLHAQTYLWCRAHPTMKVSIFGLLTIPTSLYPPALVVLDLLTGGPHKALGGVMGIVAGHTWWFCSTYLPLHAPTAIRRSNPLRAPIRFKALFRPSSSTRRGFTSGPQPTTAGTAGSASGTSSARENAQRSEAAEAVRHRWGGGQRLGGQPL